jgi:hypothetical protein
MKMNPKHDIGSVEFNTKESSTSSEMDSESISPISLLRTLKDREIDNYKHDINALFMEEFKKNKVKFIYG